MESRSFENVQTGVLTPRQDPTLGSGCKDLRNAIKNNQDQWFEGCEGPGEVHEGGDKDHNVQEQRSDIVQSHWILLCN